jgi:prephenate dehydrogenase
LVVAAVIGGAGRMGSWLATFLSKNGYQVIVTDRNTPAARRLARAHDFRYVNDHATAIRISQLVIMATPTHVTKKILENLPENISNTKAFVEISSVKAPLRSALKRTREQGISVLSIHPMFGPGAKGVEGRTVLVMPIARRSPIAGSFLRTLRRNGARLVTCSLDEHDRLISMILTLPHFLNVAFVNVLKSSGISSNLLSRIAGSTFKLQLLIAEEVHQESLDNELSVLIDNPYSATVLKKSTQASATLTGIIARGNRTMIMRTLHAGRGYLRRDRSFADAYRRFNEAVLVASLY